MPRACDGTEPLASKSRTRLRREPHIDGKLIVDGDAYLIRGVEWIVRRDGGAGDMPRFVCTLVAVPVNE